MSIEENKISSLTKALNVLEKLAKFPYEFSATELSNDLGINRTTVIRLLEDLLSSDFVIKNEETKKYLLGPKLYHLGTTYLHNYKYEDKLYELIDELSIKTNESVGLAVRDGDQVISMIENESRQPMKMNYRAGLIYPINRGCYGKCLMAYYDQKKVEKLLDSQVFEKYADNTLVDKEEILAEFEKIRKDGYAISVDETFKYAVGVGIPLRNAQNDVKACLVVSFFRDANYLKKIENAKELMFEYRPLLEKYII